MVSLWNGRVGGDGFSESFDAGKYDIDTLAKYGMNDNVQSVVVPEGFKLALYANRGFDTLLETIEGPYYEMLKENTQNNVSSFIVMESLRRLATL